MKITLDTQWQDIIDDIDNEAIVKAFLKANSVLNNYNRPYCSISGGKDSDIMLDIMWRVDKNKKIRYVWFDTGLEYQATKDHLDYLENKYGITIEREKAIKPIPLTCKEYGQPFLSKQVSKQIHALQLHGFDWVDDTFENLYKKYPKCKRALKWWCNEFEDMKIGYSSFNINYNQYLKEFIMLNPPHFPIHNICCDYAKKNVGKKFVKNNDIDLVITGVRKAEGGVRNSAYQSCWVNNKADGKESYFFPLLWFKEEDENLYDEIFNVTHSDCYNDYGLKRTGCVGCPYSRWVLDELNIINKYEPNLYKAVNNIFKDSYEYTAMYKEFIKEQKMLNT